MKKPYYTLTLHNYTKTLTRLEKSLQYGRFTKYTQQKKQEIWKRLCRYARQLGITIKAPIAAACVAAGLCFSSTAAAQQTFLQRTGTDNPLNEVNVTQGWSRANFVDIDGDGDLDVFIGNYQGTVHYYENTGTVNAPTFIERTGTLNPLDGWDVNYTSRPQIVDIDDDGDLDACVGTYGGIMYLENTGDVLAPVFVERTGIDDPFDGIDNGSYSTPCFVDIDDDGDLDFFVGKGEGEIILYRNTGTPSSPVFFLEPDFANPFDGVNAGNDCVPTFNDVDGDGDFDAFIGNQPGVIIYYKNTGTASAPVFELQAGMANPFDGVNVGSHSAPAFGDIDGDGDNDAFIGTDDGNIVYYQNTSILVPLRLLNLTGRQQKEYNQIQWQTADEVNTKWFEIERSTDGRSFVKIAVVNTTGRVNNTYSWNDNMPTSGKVFYRLKMVDIDGKFTYSHIIWITGDKATGISIYPNPVTDVMNINTGNAQILNTLAHIYNNNGRIMQSLMLTSNHQQVNVSHLAPGMYTIRFSDGSVARFMKK